MSDIELFDKALALAGFRKAELARRCRVSNQTIHSWKTGKLSEYARLKLKEFLQNADAA